MATIAEIQYREQADRAIAKRDAELAAVREQRDRLRDIVEWAITHVDSRKTNLISAMRAALDETKP